MNVSKFEAFGIGFSIIAMVVALYLVRLENVQDPLTRTSAEDSAGIVMVGDGENQRAAVADALTEASDAGKLSRVIVDDVVIGNGEVVEEGDVVTVHYIGTLQNGQQFDNTYKTGEPFQFEVGSNRVIEGWNVGLEGMRVGGERVLVIPSEMAYGDEETGPIPSGATLVFAVELLSVE